MRLDEHWSIHPEVRRLFELYKGEMFGWNPLAEYNETDKRFYVYLWFTLDEEKIFYVGKGTGKRVEHILKEIEAYEQNPRKYKGKRYKTLRDLHGISYKILLDGLSSFEAEIYEFCMMREFTKQGEVLLNYVDMPQNESEEVINSPTIVKDQFYERYLNDYSSPLFDVVSREYLISAYLNDSYTLGRDVSECRNIIKLWIESSGGKVYTHKGKKTKSVIVFGGYEYDNYLNDHKEGKKVYSSTDVLLFLKNEGNRG